jgi:hypothetical protein
MKSRMGTAATTSIFRIYFSRRLSAGVDEHGTEDAAATAVLLGFRGTPAPSVHR